MHSKKLKRPSFSLSTIVHSSIRGSASARKGLELGKLFLDVKRRGPKSRVEGNSGNVGGSDSKRKDTNDDVSPLDS